MLFPTKAEKPMKGCRAWLITATISGDLFTTEPFRIIEGHVNIHPVRYQVAGVEVAANAYTPAGYSEDGSYAAVAVAHPNGGVKEQVSGLFAQKLAEAG